MNISNKNFYLLYRIFTELFVGLIRFLYRWPRKMFNKEIFNFSFRCVHINKGKELAAKTSNTYNP